jgi:hypothetical protein
MLLLTSAACGGPVATTTPDEPPLRSRDIQGLEDRVHILEDSLPLLACGPELRALFRDIRRECNGGAPADSEASAEGKPAAPRTEAATCKVEQLKGAIASAERDLDTRSIGQKLVSLLRHEVVYLSDSLTVSSVREKRLRLLAAERRLPSTRFLVVTAPGNSNIDAERRANAVIARLSSLGIPLRETLTDGETRSVSRFDYPWIYRINVPQQSLKPADRPVPPEPRDPEKAVYIFRSECL